MPKNTMDDLRNHLFATIEALQDDDKPMDIGRAAAICEVADRLIDTAKVEVKFHEVIGSGRAPSRMLAAFAGDEPEPEKPHGVIDAPARPALVAGGKGAA
jgi:hypothetical protein